MNKLTVCCLFGASVLLAEEGAVDVLTLQEALDEALAYNLGLVSSRYSPANAQDDVIIQESAFDFELFGSVSTSERQSAASSSSLDSTSLPESASRSARAGVDKLFSTGASITLDTNISRSTSNNNSVRNPDYGSDFGLSLRQPLLKDAWSEVNLAPIARARANAQQSEYALRSDILDVLVDTEIAYWNLSFARAARELIQSNLKLATNLLEENKERQRLGLVTPLEVLQSETELTNQEEDLIEAERGIADAEDALRRLMGSTSFTRTINDSVFVEVLPVAMPPLRELDKVVADTLATDTDAKTQELAIEVQRINRLLARDDTRPDLDLFGGLTYLGRDNNGVDSHLGAYHADGYNWNVGLEVRFPWSFRDARARVRQAERNLERAEVRLYDIKQEKALAARNAWRAVQSGLLRIEVTGKALRLNEQSFEQERARYGEGLVPYRSVLEAQRDLDQARRSRLSAVIETLRAIASLSRVDGSILERNGFTWDAMDSISGPADLDSHPLLNDLETQP